MSHNPRAIVKTSIQYVSVSPDIANLIYITKKEDKEIYYALKKATKIISKYGSGVEYLLSLLNNLTNQRPRDTNFLLVV